MKLITGLISSSLPCNRFRRRRARVGATMMIAATILTFAIPCAVHAEATPTATIIRPTPHRPADAKGMVLVPDHFLRRWDPVTVFFPHDRGPANGGPEDHPDRVMTVSPQHPGAFTWLDARTLQFRPAEPWPPLARYTWVVGG